MFRYFSIEAFTLAPWAAMGPKYTRLFNIPIRLGQ
jgi:hypothetical protein